MVSTVPITEAFISLRDVETALGLQCVIDTEFFSEIDARRSDSDVTDGDRQFLGQLQDSYFESCKDGDVNEAMVNMLLISPLLHLTGFFNPPFQFKAEKSITLTIPDGDVVYSGRIDGLVIAQQFWLILVESKRPRFSASTGIPQALAYACANPDRDRPLFVMVTNGDDFIFLKVEGDRYSRPASFSIFGQGTAGLEGVLRVLRKIKAIALPTPS